MNFDIDLDFGDKEEILKLIPHVRAMSIQNDTPSNHISGVYVTEIPHNQLTNLCSFDYKEAEKLGYFKLDFLNNSLYTYINGLDHLDKLVNKEPTWIKLQDPIFVSKLIHIGSYFSLIQKFPEPVTSIDHLAMLLALIRPGKKHLIGKSWQDIEKEIWIKDKAAGYSFKKSHSLAYSLAIVVNMNLLEEQGY
jgi:hypothetical protein